MQQLATIHPSMIYMVIGNLGHTLETAIADLVDNSIQYGANYFKFGFYYDEFNINNSFAYFYDDGKGMNLEELENAMSIGSLQNKDKMVLHSKFGLGLKISSLSNCDSFQVFTKKGKEENCSMKMYFNDNKDNLFVSDKTELPKKINTVFKEYDEKKSGTLIIWNNLKKHKFKTSSHSSFFSISANIQSHLMLTFHQYLQENKFDIYYNDRKLGFIDPTIPSLNTIKLDNTKISIENETVLITPYIVPTDPSYNLSNQDSKIARSFLSKFSMDGIFLYRNNRLIDFGKWFEVISDSMRIKNSKKIKRMRIVINFNEKLDKIFGIEPTKSELELPDELRSTIYNIFEKLMKKISEQTKSTTKRTEIISDKEDFWEVKNGKISINFKNKEIMKLTENSNFQKILKEISDSIPILVTHDISVKDIKNIEGNLLDLALKSINSYHDQGHELKDCIDLVITRKPFNSDGNLKEQIRNYYNV